MADNRGASHKDNLGQIKAPNAQSLHMYLISALLGNNWKQASLSSSGNPRIPSERGGEDQDKSFGDRKKPLGRHFPDKGGQHINLPWAPTSCFVCRTISPVILSVEGRLSGFAKG